MKITQSMQAFSDKNKDLDTKDMTQYPGGGWSVIVDLSPAGVNGVALTTDGVTDFSFANARNDSGFSVIYDASSICKAFKLNEGVQNSDDGPAAVSISPNSTTVTYIKNNNLHRDGNLPATTTTFDNGVIENEEYYIDGVMTREENAAQIKRHENGELKTTRWLSNGKNHRLDGPSEQTFNEDKTLEDYKFWIEGINYTTELSWIEAGGLPSAWID